MVSRDLPEFKPITAKKVPADLAKNIKALAALNGVSLNDTVVEALKEYLLNHGQGAKKS